ncbi:MAG: cupin domain-containing protein [Bacillota bacterium]|jgi:quercetin dioxygenase-like cupin family protein
MRTSWLFLPLLLAATPIHAQAIHSTSDTKWGPPPPFLPSGAQASVVQGDPGAAGEYTIRLQMPDGYIIPPHYHPTDENVTVLSGTLMLGMGDEIDRRAADRLTAGGFAVAKANAHHYAIALGPTVVQVHGMGPFAITYIRAADDPRAPRP